MADQSQLSFVETPQIVVEFHPRRQPPDATGPLDRGAFGAQLPGVASGWRRTEQLALRSLASRMRHLAAEQTLADLTPKGQAVAAATNLAPDALLRWLRQRAGEPLVHDAAY